MGEFYEEATRGRSASHNLQVKAALALLYHVLDTPNPFSCHAPKFAPPEKTELRYHTSSQLGQLLRELRADKGSYFGRPTYHLATALFFTGCRYHEWTFGENSRGRVIGEDWLLERVAAAAKRTPANHLVFSKLGSRASRAENCVSRWESSCSLEDGC